MNLSELLDEQLRDPAFVAEYINLLKNEIAELQSDNERLRAVVDTPPWIGFLNARLRIIDQWDQDGRSAAQMLSDLCMDRGQVELLILTARQKRTDGRLNAALDGEAKP